MVLIFHFVQWVEGVSKIVDMKIYLLIQISSNIKSLCLSPPPNCLIDSWGLAHFVFIDLHYNHTGRDCRTFHGELETKDR